MRNSRYRRGHSPFSRFVLFLVAALGVASATIGILIWAGVVDSETLLRFGAPEDEEKVALGREGKVPVPLAAVAIEPYTKVSREHLINPKTGEPAVIYMDKDSLPENFCVEPGDILNRVLKGRKRAGYVFVKTDFFEKGTREGITAGIPIGKRSMRVSTRDDIKGLFELQPGDHFDLIASIPLEKKTSSSKPHSLSGPLAERLSSQKPQARLPEIRSRTIVKRGRVVTPVQTRVEPTASRSLTQGQITKNIPIQEMVIAIDASEALELSQVLAIDTAIVRCLSRSGRVDPDAVEKEIPSSSVDGSQGLFGDVEEEVEDLEVSYIEVMDGSERRTIAVPKKSISPEEDAGKSKDDKSN